MPTLHPPHLIPLALAASVVGCTLTENGTTVTGPTVGKTVQITGMSPWPQAPVRVQQRLKHPTDPKRWSSLWTTVATGNTAATNGVTYNGATWYPFDLAVTPSSLGPNEWLEGGMAKLRTQVYSTSLQSWLNTFAFDDPSCLVPYANNGESWLTIARRCQSHSSPTVTVVDTDAPSPGNGQVATAPNDPSRYLSFYPNPQSLSGTAYYTSIGAPQTLSDFKAKYGFTADNHPRAVYYNSGDLGFGRHMHCRQKGQQIGCYVENYGQPDDFDADRQTALAAAVDPNATPLATVAMEYDGTSNLNNVTFIVYGQNGQWLPKVQLDGTTAKEVPGICMNCHGGEFVGTQVKGAQFLPFDVFTFSYSNAPGYSLAHQQDAFRALNRLVIKTQPNDELVEVINNLYPDGIENDTSLARNGPPPAGWADHETLYDKVIRPYCRTCHVALSKSALRWGSYSDLLNNANVRTFVCDARLMPHAQLTAKNFFESNARAHLLGDLNLDEFDCTISD